MKSTLAIIGAFAALTTAYTPGRHLHFPRSNATTTAVGDGQTTLTVIATHVATIISCAATVTNCPAGKPEMSTVSESDRKTQVVTDTVLLTTTVCPVSEAGSISSKVISDHAGGKITGTTLTAPLTQPSAAAGGQPQTKSAEPTTTITATSTKTRTITISEAKGTQTAPSQPGSSGEACKEAPAVTVTVAQTTVTAPASTVYVTVACDGSKTASAEQPSVTDKAISGGESSPDQTNNQESGSEEDCSSDITTTMVHTVTVVPYPAGNSTSTSTGAVGPSGFARLRR